VSRPHALLLDLDGTLVDSEPIHRTGFERWFAHRGWPFDLEVAALFTGRRADDVFRTVDGPWSGGDPDAMFAEIVAMVPRDRLPDAVPGAAATIERAAVAGIPLALVTSASVRWADKALAALGGLGRFDVVVTRDDVAWASPTRPATPSRAIDSGWMPGRHLRARTHPTGCSRPSGRASARSSG
jgi:sugar-phosphatase